MLTSDLFATLIGRCTAGGKQHDSILLGLCVQCSPVQAHPKVRLGRAHSKMVQRVANVGRVIKDMSGMGNRTQSMLHVDQPELDARFVYVGVHADGPTRVLCFSETKDQYTRGSNEESMSLLTSKLARLEERIKASHSAPHHITAHQSKQQQCSTCSKTCYNKVHYDWSVCTLLQCAAQSYKQLWVALVKLGESKHAALPCKQAILTGSPSAVLATTLCCVA